MGKREFLLLAPREADRLIAAHLAARSHQELLFAQVVAMVANTGFRGFEKPREAKEFMPSEWGKRAAASRPRRRTHAQIAAELRRTMERAVAYQAEQARRGIR